MEFNTIAISDGVTMGTEGMRASLVSREVIADSIELVCRGHMFDAVVCVVACDKTIPGGGHGAGAHGSAGRGPVRRHDRCRAAINGKDITIQDVFEAVGANAAGRMTDKELLEISRMWPVRARARAAGSTRRIRCPP
jgi:dihydroxy-acid dehydratase